MQRISRIGPAHSHPNPPLRGRGRAAGETERESTAKAIFIVQGSAQLTKPGSLLVGRFVLTPNPDNNDSSRLLIDLVEDPVIPPRPDAELILPASHFVVTAWPWITLEVHDRPSDAKKRLVVQLK